MLKFKKGVIIMAEKTNTEYIKVVGGYLELRQKLTGGKPSASGKSNVYVSTGGFMDTEDGGYRANVTLINKK